MNSTDCPETLARDHLLIFSSSCDSNLVVYVFFCSLTTVLKFVHAVGFTLQWLIRQKRRGSRPARSVSGRYPIIPIAGAVLFLSYFAFTVTTSLGICNASNGCTVALFTSMFTAFGVLTTLFLIHLINLGQRIIPLSKMKIISGPAANQHQVIVAADGSGRDERGGNSGDSHDVTARIDMMQSVMVGLQIFCLIGGWIVGVPITLALASPDTMPKFVTAMFAFEAGYFLTAMTPVIIQFQRLILVTKQAVFRAPVASQSPSSWASRAIWKMRQTQAVLGSITILTVTIILLIVVQVIVPGWYILVILFVAETTSSSFSFLAFVVKPFQKEFCKKRAKRIAGAETVQASTNDVAPGVVTNTKSASFEKLGEQQQQASLSY